MTAPVFGWYGDDFTGATDTLSVLAQAGLRSMLFMGIPSAAALHAAGPLDAVGIAGAARAMAPEAMRAELLPVGRFFQSLAPAVLHYKVCSTFDSAPAVGNMACAIEALHPSVDHAWIPIVGGQPSLGRYCAFSHLFAAAGTGGEVHRIDRHPTMRQHPVTPMNEADLRIHLSKQGLQNITSLHFPQYAVGSEALEQQLGALHSPGQLPQPMVLDVTEASQLALLGRLLWQQAQKARLLAVGSSAIAQALVAYWKPAATNSHAPLAPVTAPVFAWAGSLSPLTAAQVQAANSYERMAIDGPRLSQDENYAQAMHDRICAGLAQGQHVLAYTAPSATQTVDTHAVASVAQASAALVAKVVQTQASSGTPLQRVGIAGGDTSSHAVQALQLWGLSYQSTICPGVTLSCAHSEHPALHGMELMLKGGQMGGLDLFERLLGE